MKNKTIDILLFFIVVLLLTSYFWIKNVVWDYEAYLNNFDQIEKFAKNDEWESATSLARDMREKWHKNNWIIMFNYGEAEFSLFEESLNHILAGSETKDLAEVLSYTKNAQDLWKNFNRVVPEP